jgi:N-acetylglucosaminyl-diphospho-decaprenol L-rhamnosyltransferase
VISSVVVTYNSAACVLGCVASVRRALPDAEIIVVDNGSEDDTVAAVREAGLGARVMEAGGNVGFGRACNIGATGARGEYLLFLNPDSIVASVDRERLDRLLETLPLGVVAAYLEGEGDPRRLETSWVTDYVGHTFATLRPHEWRPPSIRKAKRNSHGPGWVSAAMLLVAKHEFLGLGGFDPRFFLYYEDRDLSHRYHDAGFDVRTTDAVTGRHARGASSGHDRLRVAPMAWSVLGWIQYLCIYSGDAVALRAARATMVTLRILRAALRVLAAFGWRRAKRKTDQLDGLFDFLGLQVSAKDAGFCPDAVRVMRAVR